jgi:hypothetical protein
MAQKVEHLPNKHQAPSSNASTASSPPKKNPKSKNWAGSLAQVIEHLLQGSEVKPQYRQKEKKKKRPKHVAVVKKALLCII